MSHLLNGQCARLSLVISVSGGVSGNSGVRRHCSRCKQPRTFASSGKFRVNAQKKLIDIWLIYRCLACDQTWNHAIHERTSVRALPPDAFDAYMRNDPGLARHHAGLLGIGMGHGEAAAEPEIARQVLVPAGATTERLEVLVSAPPGNAVRLDRVLALGLGLPRHEVARLAEAGVLTVVGGEARVLRRPATDGQVAAIDLRRCPPELTARCLQVLG